MLVDYPRFIFPKVKYFNFLSFRILGVFIYPLASFFGTLRVKANPFSWVVP